MHGGPGNDIFSKTAGTGFAYGGRGLDTLSFYWADQPVVVHMDPGHARGGLLDFRFSDIEIIYGSRAHGDYLEGDSSANRLSGYGGNDWLAGKDGNDFLEGGAGNDFLEGGRGTNQLLGGDGADTFIFAEGEVTRVMDFNAAEGDRLQFQFDGPPPGLDTNGGGFLTRFDDNVRLVDGDLHIDFGGGRAIIADTGFIASASYDELWVA